jgi:hypothetical protein
MEVFAFITLYPRRQRPENEQTQINEYIRRKTNILLLPETGINPDTVNPYQQQEKYKISVCFQAYQQHEHRIPP